MVAVLIERAGMTVSTAMRVPGASGLFRGGDGTRFATPHGMKTVLAFALASSLVACVHRETTPRDKQDFGNWLGQSTASAPADPTQPVAKDPDVTEGGGTLQAFVGSGPGGVTPTVGERPDTLQQAKGPTTTDTSGGQPGTVYAPSLAPPFTSGAPVTAPTTVVPSTPVSGPITGAGPNGPGTGTGPATSTGPGTSRVTPTPTPSGPTAAPVSTPGPR
jgi:hypothetical protein